MYPRWAQVYPTWEQGTKMPKCVIVCGPRCTRCHSESWGDLTVSNSNFASEIKPDFYCNQTESVFGSLFKEYERVVFRSLITAFGLDLFIRDQYGGDVDTIHNVRQIGDGSPMAYKNAANAAAYADRGDYPNER